MKNKNNKLYATIPVLIVWGIGFIKYSNEPFTLFIVLFIGLILGVIASKLVD